MTAGLILEGPDSWPIRPVAELLVDREFGQHRLDDVLATSALVGGIARWTDSVSFDVAFRLGGGGEQREEEIRAGLTWAFGLR